MSHAPRVRDSRAEPLGDLLYFDPDADRAEATISTLRMAGYAIEHISCLAESQQAFGDPDAPGADWSALIVDARDCSTDAELTVELAEQAAGDGPAIPIVVIASKDHPVPFPAAERLAVLKGPFATPALVRLVEHVGRTSSPSKRDDPEARAPAAPPPRVGAYQLLAKIALGGMGTVYVGERVDDTELRRLYAVKLLHPHLAEDADYAVMLRDEACLAARLHHPNTAAVIDQGKEGDHPYIVMEYVEGCSLADLIRKSDGVIPINCLNLILAQTLEGLHAAHTLRDEDGQALDLIHRDVSADNILVGADGVARIADFGIAKSTGKVSRTESGVFKGKLALCAPERLLDEQTIDCRADLFTAGVVYWNALTGRRLFSGANGAQIINKIMSAEIVAPGEFMPVPAALDQVCLRALERDPNRRYQSALEMAQALRAAAGAQGLLASPAEVAELVENLWGKKLADRREAVRKARETGARESTTDGLVATEPGREDSSNTIPDIQPVRHSGRRWQAYGLVLVLVAGVGVWSFSGSCGETSTDVPVAAANPGHVAAPTQPKDGRTPGHTADADAGEGAPTTKRTPSTLLAAPAPSDHAPPQASAPAEPTEVPAATGPSAPDNPEPTASRRKKRRQKSSRTRDAAPSARPTEPAPSPASSEDPTTRPTQQPRPRHRVERNPYQ